LGFWPEDVGDPNATFVKNIQRRVAHPLFYWHNRGLRLAKGRKYLPNLKRCEWFAV